MATEKNSRARQSVIVAQFHHEVTRQAYTSVHSPEQAQHENAGNGCLQVAWPNPELYEMNMEKTHCSDSKEYWSTQQVTRISFDTEMKPGILSPELGP